jgi:hypothetical protein
MAQVRDKDKVLHNIPFPGIYTYKGKSLYLYPSPIQKDWQILEQDNLHSILLLDLSLVPFPSDQFHYLLAFLITSYLFHL